MTPDPSYKDDLRAAYDADVERRDAMTPAAWRTGVIDRFANLLRAEHAQKVIELGCGTGQLASHMQDTGLDITAVDLSPGNAAATAARGVTAVEADFADLPFPDAAFDGAFAIHSLIHAPNEELPAVFTEIRRVLIPHAPLLMVVWGGVRHDGPFAHEWLEPPRYFSLYTDEQIIALDKPGFELEEFETIDTDESELHAQVLTLRAT
ncbi:MAG: class I SAM-dependent methyltransferase [Acidimicrobiia bacterium]|nr:class I SAM-dependent methyltransferase [Acidimicrobiia bacterium]